MDVTVTITTEEFWEFMAWKKELDKETGKRELMAKKTTWAMEEDAKRPGKVKIIDQEHAAELLEMAREYLA